MILILFETEARSADAGEPIRLVNSGKNDPLGTACCRVGEGVLATCCCFIVAASDPQIRSRPRQRLVTVPPPPLYAVCPAGGAGAGVDIGAGQRRGADRRSGGGGGAAVLGDLDVLAADRVANRLDPVRRVLAHDHFLDHPGGLADHHFLVALADLDHAVLEGVAAHRGARRRRAAVDGHMLGVQGDVLLNRGFHHEAAHPGRTPVDEPLADRDLLLGKRDRLFSGANSRRRGDRPLGYLLQRRRHLRRGGCAGCQAAGSTVVQINRTVRLQDTGHGLHMLERRQHRHDGGTILDAALVDGRVVIRMAAKQVAPEAGLAPRRAGRSTRGLRPVHRDRARRHVRGLEIAHRRFGLAGAGEHRNNCFFVHGFDDS